MKAVRMSHARSDSYVRRLTLPGAMAVALLLAAGAAFAEPGPGEDKSGWNGTAGFGPIFFPKYTGGKGMQVWPIPIINAQYGDIADIELLRATVYFWGSDDKKMGFGIAAEPRLGFHASDGALLSGMATRRHSIEAGPSFDWENDIVDLNLSYFGDPTHASGGTSARVTLYKDLVKTPQLTFGALLGLDRISNKVSNYYFGVRQSEATANRSFYQGSAATNMVAGADGSYKLDKLHSVVFGVNSTRLGSGSGASPIVETRQSTFWWAGFTWNLGAK